MDGVFLLVPLAVFSSGDTRTAEEWKSRVVYQLLTDRFSQGENDLDTKCTDLRDWCGGTYQGIISKLDYLEVLGITAIWISPIVENTKLGYHGYWAKNIYELESHFGTKEDLIELVTECHKRDIWVMVDVVPNHMGYPEDCFWDACNDPEDFSELFPFNEKKYYHDLCLIRDFDNQTEVEQCRLSYLPDLKQENAEVRSLLYEWISMLTEVYNFDGYRIDTARHIAKDFWPDFQKAAGTYVIGEISVDERHVEYISEYQQVMEGILNFPTYYSLRNVYANGFPMLYLYNNIFLQRQYYKDMKLTGAFIDNHDQSRFLNLTKGDLGKLKNSLAFILYGDGIPIIYQGTELGFTGGSDPENRESMWPHFSTGGEIYQFISLSLDYRRRYLDAVAGDKQNDILVDPKTYIFEKGDFEVIVAITSAKKEDGGYVIELADLPIEDYTPYVNIYTGEVVFPADGKLDIVFGIALEPIVLVKFKGQL